MAAKKFETTSGGVEVSSGNLTMQSNGRIFVGNGGNATNPMFANVSDTNTGIAFPAADTMLFTTSGSERLRITSGGVVNIGDSSPNADGSGALNVYSSATGALSQFVHAAGNGGLRIGGTGSGSAANLVFSNDYNNNSWVDEWTIQMHGSDDSLRFLSGGVSGTERLRITSDGKVGVGVAAPAQMMEIVNTSGTGSQIQFRDTSTAQGNNNGARFGYNGSGAQIWNFENTYIRFATNNVERLRITSAGVLQGGSTNSTGGSTLIENRYSDPHVLNILGSMYSTGNTTLTYGLRPKSGSSGYVSSYANFNGRRAALEMGQGTFEFYSTGQTNTAVGNDVTTTRNMFLNHDGKLELRYDNSGGVGAYLSLQNRGTATGTRTGISFAVGNSDAILNATDYGEAEIHVHRDSGGHGNFDFRCHTGANRSWLKIIGNGQNQGGAGAGTEGMRGGVAFGCAGIAIDRSWTGQPGIHVFNQNVEGDTDQSVFRFHGWNRSYASYPGSSGSDFGVSLVADGMSLTSDRRRKTGITTITGALDTVSQMRGVSFTYVNQDLEPQTHMSMSNGRKLGFIAQEVIPLLPELILDSGEKAVELDNGYCDRYNMDYGGVTPLLVEAIKELKAQNEALQARIAALEGS